MLITCPNCGTSYDLDTGALRDGRSVRCARCQVTWFAAPTRELTIAGARSDLWTESDDEADRDLRTYLGPANAMVPSSYGMQDYQMDAPPLAPAAQISDYDGQTTIDVEPTQDIETIAARRARERPARRIRDRRGLPIAALIILGCGAALAALAHWRADVVRLAPQTATLYARLGLEVNVRGLSFRNVKSTSEMHEGMPVLVIEGSIVNVAKAAADVPRMRFAVRNESGLEVYAWTAQPAQPTLATGEALPFRTRLASPPGDTHDVFVRFFNRRDLAESGRS